MKTVKNNKKKFGKMSCHEKPWIRIRIGIDFKSLIRIRIRIETNMDPKHWSRLCTRKLCMNE